MYDRHTPASKPPRGRLKGQTNTGTIYGGSALTYQERHDHLVFSRLERNGVLVDNLWVADAPFSDLAWAGQSNDVPFQWGENLLYPASWLYRVTEVWRNGERVAHPFITEWYAEHGLVANELSERLWSYRCFKLDASGAVVGYPDFLLGNLAWLAEHPNFEASMMEI